MYQMSFALKIAVDLQKPCRPNSFERDLKAQNLNLAKH